MDVEEVNQVDCGVDLTTDQDGGVIKEILKEGFDEAHPTTGNKVFVHYVGKLLDGTVFDSSRTANKEFSFVVGRKQVIEGFDIAIKTMRLGELAKIRIAPKYGYGEKGSPPKIPPDATLIFEIELLRWEGEDISPDRDKSILKTVQVAGEGYETAKEGATASIHVKAVFEDRLLFDKDFDVTVGECSEAGLPEGIDKALMRIRKGETSHIVLQPKWAYGQKGNAELGVPPNATVNFLVTTSSFENPKEFWSMSDEERVSEYEKLKERGTEFLKAGKYKLAAAKYRKVVEQLEPDYQTKDDLKEKGSALLKASLLNLALVCVKLNETVEAIKCCDKVLGKEPSNVKALYRRAQARQGQHDYEEATADYEALLEIEPDNKAATANLSFCRSKLREERVRQKQLYSSMLTKMKQTEQVTVGGSEK